MIIKTLNKHFKYLYGTYNHWNYAREYLNISDRPDPEDELAKLSQKRWEYIKTKYNKFTKTPEFKTKKSDLYYLYFEDNPLLK